MGWEPGLNKKKEASWVPAPVCFLTGLNVTSWLRLPTRVKSIEPE